MNKFDCEMFGHFSYDDSLTYQELLDMEAWIIGQIQLLLDDQDAVHIDFTPLGDELMVQCAFDVYDQDIFHALCQRLCLFLPPQMESRLLFVDKHLASLSLYHINHETWQETPIGIPLTKEVLSPVKNSKGAAKKRKA